MEIIVGIFLIAFATSLGWAVRGEWGNWWGETVPGAFAGMAIWLAFGQSNSAWQMLAFGAALAVAHTVGGDISYGKIIGYVVSRRTIFDREKENPANRSPLYGLFALFLVGGMIGFFPATALGLLITSVSYDIGDLALWAVLASAGAFLTYKLIVLGLGFRLSPPRSDYWAATLGGSLASMAFFTFISKDFIVVRTGLLGWLGYGFGFMIGGLIHRRAVKAGWRVDSWKWMERSVGFFGGLGLGVSAVLGGYPLVEIPLGATEALLSFIVVFWFTPYLILSDVFQDWAFRCWLIGTPRSVSLLPGDPEGFNSPPPEKGWKCIISRRSFTAFHALALLSLVPLSLLALHLVATWDGVAFYRLPFVTALCLFTGIGIIKFLPVQRDREKLMVQATFVIQILICLMLLLLV